VQRFGSLPLAGARGHQDTKRHSHKPCDLENAHLLHRNAQIVGLYNSMEASSYCVWVTRASTSLGHCTHGHQLKQLSSEFVCRYVSAIKCSVNPLLWACWRVGAYSPSPNLMRDTRPVYKTSYKTQCSLHSLQTPPSPWILVLVRNDRFMSPLTCSLTTPRPYSRFE